MKNIKLFEEFTAKVSLFYEDHDRIFKIMKEFDTLSTLGKDHFGINDAVLSKIDDYSFEVTVVRRNLYHISYKKEGERWRGFNTENLRKSIVEILSGSKPGILLEKTNPLFDKEIYSELQRKFGIDRGLISFDYTPNGISITVNDYNIFANKFTKGDARTQVVQPVIKKIENYINKKYGNNVRLHEILSYEKDKEGQSKVFRNTRFPIMGNERKVQSAEGYNVGDEVVVKNLNATITEIVEKPRFDGSYKEYWFVVEFEDQELSDDMVRSYALKKRPSAMSSRVSFS